MMNIRIKFLQKVIFFKDKTYYEAKYEILVNQIDSEVYKLYGHKEE